MNSCVGVKWGIFETMSDRDGHSLAYTDVFTACFKNIPMNTNKDYSLFFNEKNDAK